MSAGTSNSSGSESSNASSTGTRTGTSKQDSTQNTTFDTSTLQQTQVPVWARRGAKDLFAGRQAGEHEAVDFLTGLLSNPLDSSEPKNRYAKALDDVFSTQLTRARSGDAQSVGVGKQGQREAAALTGAQTAAIGTGTNAANSLLTNANPFSALDFTRLISPTSSTTHGTSDTTGQINTQSNEQTAGQQQSSGQSSGSNSGFGITLCCFIFLEYYHGKLPWFVRRCRDEFCSGRRVTGYRRMASVLVPKMRQSKLVTSTVWQFMIRPLTAFGGWLYHEPGYGRGWLAAPIVAFWFGIWSLLGKEKK